MDKDFVAWQKIAGLQIYSKTSLKFGDAGKNFWRGESDTWGVFTIYILGKGVLSQCRQQRRK